MKLDTKDYVIAVLIIIGALIAGIFSAYQYLENARKDKADTEMAEKISDAQQQTIDKANELITAQNKIAQLQDEIVKQSKIQSQGISDIKNPIPLKFDLNLDSQIVLTAKEQMEIKKFLEENQPVRNIPFEAKKGSCDKIDRLKDVFFGLTIRIEKEGKTLKIKYEKKITNLLGYTTNNPQNAFHLTYDGNELNFSAYRITIEDIEADYIPKTINDFENAKVHIQYAFFFPHKGLYMNIDANFYVLKIKEISLDSGGKIFEIKNLKNSDSGYTGTFSF